MVMSCTTYSERKTGLHFLDLKVISPPLHPKEGRKMFLKNRIKGHSSDPRQVRNRKWGGSLYLFSLVSSEFFESCVMWNFGHVSYMAPTKGGHHCLNHRSQQKTTQGRGQRCYPRHSTNKKCYPVCWFFLSVPDKWCNSIDCKMLVTKVFGFTVIVFLRPCSVSFCMAHSKGGYHVLEKEKSQRGYARHASNKK